ncbi:MAG: HEAT repeat domain-containing protein [Gammaproteobacteria bacterium]|nr:HEAT repeat domain-containing protein [Gammaproteobacteria bacterium]
MTSGDALQLPELRAALGSSDRHQRAYAAIQLGRHQDQHSIDQLRTLTREPDELVAIAAMYGCWQLGVDAIAIDRMVAALSSDDEELVQESVFALCEIGEAVVPKLTEFLETQAASPISVLCVLADIGGGAAFDVISSFKSDDPDVRSTIQELLEDWDDD